MEAGTRARTVAATAMNATSSRAHTIFQVILTQTTVDPATGNAMDKVSVISLIDLAGSERADRTGAMGDRLKEGCAINQSLSALGNVISALADQATGVGNKKPVVPYRDSVLTHLLKNSLGGNAKTIMIAAISPSCVNYEETMSTLRYADRAKQIKNKAIINEDPHQKLIRGLKEEIEQLRLMLQTDVNRPATADMKRIREEVSENERLLKESELSWEDRLKLSHAHLAQNNEALLQLGMGVDNEKKQRTPHLVNLNQDPQMSGVLCYFFEEGLTRIGRKDAQTKQTIVLSGLSIRKEHATVSRVQSELTLEALPDAKVHHNGQRVAEVTVLAHGDRLVFGNNHVFSVVLPGGGPQQETTWEEAMNELNEQQIVQLTEGERRAREKAEEEAREMQERVQALEKRMQEERTRAEKEARKATDAEREKMVAKQRELEQALQAQIDSTTKKQKLQDEVRRRRALLEEQILRTLPLIAEANAISEELTKARSFSLKLIATQMENRLSALKTETDPIDAIDAEEVASRLETSVWIRVEQSNEDIPLMWEYEKFVTRLYLMREMYEDFVECGRNFEEIDNIYGQEYDPFFDPVEEHLIGKAYVMLTPLVYFIPIDDTPPIIQYQGKTDGALRVSIGLDEEDIRRLAVLDTDEEKTLGDFVGESLHLTVRVVCAQGLPRKMCRQVAVTFKFFDQTFRTPPSEHETINPRFDHLDRIDIPVTEEFVHYVQKQPLEFQVWGMSVQPANPAGGPSAALSSASPTSPALEIPPSEVPGVPESLVVEEPPPRSTATAEPSPKVDRRRTTSPKVARKAAEDGPARDDLEQVRYALTTALDEKSQLAQKNDQLERQVRALAEQLAEKSNEIARLEQQALMIKGSIELQKAQPGAADSKACKIQ